MNVSYAAGNCCDVHYATHPSTMNLWAYLNLLGMAKMVYDESSADINGCRTETACHERLTVFCFFYRFVL